MRHTASGGEERGQPEKPSPLPEQLELRAWFVDHTADELLLAQVNAAEKGEAA